MIKIYLLIIIYNYNAKEHLYFYFNIIKFNKVNFLSKRFLVKQIIRSKIYRINLYDFKNLF